MSAMVVDASLAAAWMLVDELNEDAEAVLDQLKVSTGSVPALFWYETRNLFLKAERRGRCSPEETLDFMIRLRELPLESAEDGSDHDILALARAASLSAYDAAYLALAVQQRLPLATGDKRLAIGARAQGIALIGPFAEVVRDPSRR